MDVDLTTEVSFVISWNIARAKRPYFEDRFVKKNIAEVVANLDSNNARLQLIIAQTSVSRRTTERCISQIKADAEGKMQNDFKISLAFSLALDESRHLQGNSQMAVFICYFF